MANSVEDFRRTHFCRQEGEFLAYYPLGWFGRGYVVDERAIEQLNEIGCSVGGNDGTEIGLVLNAIFFFVFYWRLRRVLRTCPRSETRLTWAEHRRCLRAMWKGELG